VVIKLEIKCSEDANKVFIPHHEYRAIIQQIEELKKADEMDDDSDRDNDSGEDEEYSRDYNQNKETIKQYNEDSSNNNDQ
jgi:hypothetical protein